MCCLFGLLDYNHSLDGKRKSQIISVLSKECEIRGTDATGIAYVSRDRLRIFKRPLPARQLHFHIPDDSTAVMGHTRMATQGCEKYNANNHPFEGRCDNTRFALAHNGVLHNDQTLRKQYRLPNTRIQTDSYVAVQLLEQERALSLDSLKNMAETVEGSFTFTVLDTQDNLYFVKGSSPMCIYHFQRAGFYLYASTEEILLTAVRKLRLSKLPHEKILLDNGDILKVDSQGHVEAGNFQPTCFFNDFGFSRLGWFPPYEFHQPKRIQDDYLQELREMAGYYGYSPEDIDILYARGYSCEEIEECLYDEDYLEDF